eukprot:jgi/Chrzof1/11156/Cz05g26010.t1
MLATKSPVSLAQPAARPAAMHFKPSGRFQVGVKDFAYSTAPSPSEITAESHVVGRLYYPCKPSFSWPVSWIRAYPYAEGYVSWSLRGSLTLKQQLLKQVAQNVIYLLGQFNQLKVTYDAPPRDEGPFPVVLFSHGAAGMRNTYSVFCTELASKGFVVAALEHADGTASCVQLANGEYQMLKGLGSGSVLESKCTYRVNECLTCAKVLTAMNVGEHVEGLHVSGDNKARNPFEGLLDMESLAIMGHSCGAATAAAAISEHPQFKCGVALDPWWPLLPHDNAALHGWRTQAPLLVIGSHAWNKPPYYCDGPRQQKVFKATTGRNGHGGGCIHIVPSGTNHHSFSDLPFLLHPVLMNALRKWGKLPSNPVLTPAQGLDLVGWAMHNFLQQHLPLGPDSPAAMTESDKQEHHHIQEHLEQQQQAAQAAADEAMTSAERTTSTASSMAELLEPDENVMLAEERLSHAEPQEKPGAGAGHTGHAISSDVAVKASSVATIESQPQQQKGHVVVRKEELQDYKDYFGEYAEMLTVYTP